MKVRFKKLNERAVMPRKAHATDAGFDLTATSSHLDEFGCAVYKTGIAVEIPKGYVGLVFPRSSIAKYAMSLTNSVGVIDSNFRGEILCKFKPNQAYRNADHITINQYKEQDRIAQLIILPYPEIEFEEAEELSESDRGTNGYGSTGR